MFESIKIIAISSGVTVGYSVFILCIISIVLSTASSFFSALVLTISTLLISFVFKSSKRLNGSLVNLYVDLFLFKIYPQAFHSSSYNHLNLGVSNRPIPKE